MTEKEVRFRRLGGVCQLKIDSFRDLPGILSLDDAFWAVTAMDTELLRFDRQFLAFLDTDRNGRIRSDEVRAAVRFLLEHLRTGKGVDGASGVLELADIRTDGPDGERFLAAARLILKNLGKPEADAISVSEIAADKSIKAAAASNGDGVLAVTPDMPQEPAAALRLAIELEPTPVLDLSGEPGADQAALDGAEKMLRAWTAHREEPAADPERFLPFGEDTDAVFALFSAAEKSVEESFFSAASQRFRPQECEFGTKLPLGTLEELRKAMGNAPAALPDAEGNLDFSGPLNPCYGDALRALGADPRFAPSLREGKLSHAAWMAFKEKLAPYADWKKRTPAEAERFDAMDPALLKGFLDHDSFGELRAMAAADLAAGETLAAGTELLKLALFQQYMLEFVNNFVSLTRLFDPDLPSRLQAGTLVIDGRHFTLAVPVRDPGEHKKIIQGSDICVAYVEITRKEEKHLLAVAVTSGSMRTLFIGRRGVFFSADGTIFDAKIVDLQEHPVSIAEALKNPFFRFGEFIGKQADKFFTTQSAAVQKDMAGAISSGKLPKPPAPAQTPALSGSMLLMGGGIGLAAVGSSVAFIIKSLQNVSVVNVLVILLGILLVFGGPMVVISLVQLFRRNLSRFLEASGCAVNHRMRLSLRMGQLFCFYPRRPGTVLKLADPVELIARGVRRTTRKRTFPRRLLLVLAAVLLGAGAGAALSYFLFSPGEQPVCMMRVDSEPGHDVVSNEKTLPPK